MNMLHPEYNIAPVAGSTLGVICTDEARAKISDALKGRKHTLVARKKMSKAQIGNKKWLGRKHTDETLAKMSKAQKGRTISEEARIKLSAANKGRKHTNEAKAKMSKAGKGRKHTADAKANMSKAQKGHKVSKETRAKLSAAHKGKRLSKEHRASISAAISGVKHPLYGKRHSPETRANMRKASAARWTSEARAEFGTKRRGLEQHQVHDIRHLLALGDMTQREIAEYFPVVEAVIGNINTGRTYADW